MRAVGGLRHLLLVPLFLAVIPLSPAHSQQPFAGTPRPVVEWPPLLYVRLDGPPGTKVTFYRGGPAGQSVPMPVVVGLRPGYIYRVQVSNPEKFPNADFFPTLEVRGSLRVASNLRAGDFPAGLNFSEEDFRSVGQGALLTKVVVLEPPEHAVPMATRPDQPLEIQLPTNQDPLLMATYRGHPLLVVRAGQRQLTSEDLAAQGIAGTILLPGEKNLGWPRIPPWVGHTCFPVFDPLAGPRPAHEEMNIYDGGDVGLRAGLDPQGRLRGLDPSDTVAEYFDSQGRRRLAVSNRVGLCIPRFLLIRGESTLAGQVALVGPGATRVAHGQVTLLTERPVIQETHQRFLEGVSGRLRPSGNAVTEGTAVTGRVDGTLIFSTPQITGSLQTMRPPPITEGQDRPLLIIKWPDKYGALVGEIVTFYLKFTNQGERPITDVVVTDSLAARFEYGAGSAKVDREAVFTTQPNEAGSMTLRWQFPGTLQAGQSGMVSFQVRVR
jgi:uncharacterized repeat protein (TIGR01451 family)